MAARPIRGYWLRTKYFGWERFCKTLKAPPFSLWRTYPGYERLETTIKLSEKMSSTRAGFLRTLNRKRPRDVPKMTKCPLTPKVVAREFRMIYRTAIVGGKGIEG